MQGVLLILICCFDFNGVEGVHGRDLLAAGVLLKYCAAGRDCKVDEDAKDSDTAEDSETYLFLSLILLFFSNVLNLI